MVKFMWLGQADPDPHELKEQVLDAAGIACAALEDAKRGEVAGALEDAEAQVVIARNGLSTLQNTSTESGFIAEAQNAVLQAERCTAEIRTLVAPKKSAMPWIVLGVVVVVGISAWSATR
jgi:hypothetical protein